MVINPTWENILDLIYSTWENKTCNCLGSINCRMDVHEVFLRTSSYPWKQLRHSLSCSRVSRIILIFFTLQKHFHATCNYIEIVTLEHAFMFLILFQRSKCSINRVSISVFLFQLLYTVWYTCIFNVLVMHGCFAYSPPARLSGGLEPNYDRAQSNMGARISELVQNRNLQRRQCCNED